MPRKARRPPKERPPDPDTPDAPWRLFLAVPLPAEVTALVGDLVGDLEKEGWPVRWVAPDTSHLTIAFIGEVPAEQAELLRMALPVRIAAHAPFRLRTADLGVFPNLKLPRVLWLGLYGPAHRLVTLREAITGLLRELDLPHDDRPFHPHITLGRVRSGGNLMTRHLPEAIRRRFADEAERGRATARAPLQVPIDEIVLVRSILGRDGARHETLGRYPLVPKTGIAKTASRPDTAI
ncbi:MAG: RNA 2',3'-cyclic phosphodiesterase [Thermomicrobiales bacterium]